MLIHPTVERLRSLGLAAMADTPVELQNNPEAAEMSHADWLGLLIDREAPRQPPPLTPIDRRQAPSDGHHREHRLSYVTWSRSISLSDTRDLPMGT